MIFAFYVSGHAGRLRSLIRQQSSVLKDTKLVITDSDSNADLRSELQLLDIEFHEFNYNERIQNREKGVNLKLSDFILEKFSVYHIDYCFCFGDHILKGQLLSHYKHRIINFHPSILPMHPGRLSIDKAMNDDTTILLGHTAHFIDEGMDTGPIIMQCIVPKSFFQNDDYNSLLDLQIDMLEFIFTSLLEDRVIVKGGKVTIKKPQNIKPSFHYNHM